MQALHRRHPKLVVLGISLDADIDVARALVARHGLTFPVIHDPQGILAGRFRVTEIPASFVVDHGGRVLGGQRCAARRAGAGGRGRTRFSPSPSVPTVTAQR